MAFYVLFLALVRFTFDSRSAVATLRQPTMSVLGLPLIRDDVDILCRRMEVKRYALDIVPDRLPLVRIERRPLPPVPVWESLRRMFRLGWYRSPPPVGAIHSYGVIVAL